PHPADRGWAAYYERAARGLAAAATRDELKERYTILLGRERGAITAGLAALADVAPEARRTRGKNLNLLKRWLTEAFDARRATLEAAAQGVAGLDITLPGRRPWVGRPHVLAQVRDELLDLFHGLGYSV